MKITPLAVPGAALIEFAPRRDERGSFTRVFCADTLRQAVNLSQALVHINHSVSLKAGTVRGLRYQVAPAAECKIVRCLRGRTYDVMVDVRKNSPFFLQSIALELTPLQAVFIPEGVAHGFQTLEEACEVMYMTTAAYLQSAERSIRYNDPRHSLTWPLPVAEISPHDAAIPFLSADFDGV